MSPDRIPALIFIIVFFLVVGAAVGYWWNKK